MKSRDYWIERGRENENKLYNEGSKLTKEIEKELTKARREIEKSTNDLIVRYMDKTELDYNEAIKNLTSKEFTEWKGTLKQYEDAIKELKKINPEQAKKLKIELETLATKSRISRLDSLKAQIDVELIGKSISDEEVLKKGVSDVYMSSFNMTAKDLRAVNATLDMNQIEILIQTPWSGANFSERIWDNREMLSKVLKQEITQAFIQGVNVKTLASRIASRMNADLKNTERLVRTEIIYAHNQASKLSYEDAGIDEYEFLAELGERTCEKCKPLNGKVFKMQDMQVGVNYPPIHPRCRCSTIPVLDYDSIGKKDMTKDEKSGIIKEEENIFLSNDLKTKKEFTEFLKNDLEFDLVQTTGLKLDSLKEIAKDLEQAYKEYPNLRGFIKEFRLSKTGSVASAGLQAGKKGKMITSLTFNIDDLSNKNKIDALIQHSVTSGDWTQKNGIGGILRHELGHMLEYEITINRNGLNINDDYSNKVREWMKTFAEIKQGKFSKEVIDKVFDPSEKVNIATKLSKYATTKSQETLAECIGCDDDKNDLANRVKRYVKGVI